MRIKPARSLVATAMAAVLLGGGLAACGDDDDSADNTAVSTEDAGAADGVTESTAALVPTGTGDPFVDAMAAAGHMPMTADALAGGIVTAAEIKGSVDSPASDLRAHLTHILTEHVYLAGIAVATAYHAGADSPEFALAAAALDTNSVKVADAIGTVVPDKRDAFLESWRAHVDDFVAYAVAAKGGDAAGKKKALNNLADYSKTSGEFFDEISGGALPAKDIQAAFDEHIDLVAGAIDAFAAGKTNAYSKLKKAAAHMPMAATVLAGGIDKATKMDGNPNDDAAGLRATLTDYLTSHVYLASVAVFTAYTAGADSEAFTAAAAALDENSVEIADAITSVAGKAKGETFLEVWRSHINDFVTYAVGAAEGDQAKMDTGLTNLDAYRSAAGDFFADVTGGALPADAVASELEKHITSLAGAIDSLKAALVA